MSAGTIPSIVRIEDNGDEYFVRRTKILTTDTVVYSVWERAGDGWAGHTTMTTADYRAELLRLGSLRSRKLDAITEALEGPDVYALFAARDEVAYDLIRCAYPHLAEGSFHVSESMGELAVVESKDER